MLTIGRVQTFLASGGPGQKNCVFVRVETTDGLVGWGESFSMPSRDQAVARHVEEMAQYLAARIARTPFEVHNGYIELPTAPGLGYDLDEDALAREVYQRYPKRAIRTYADEGP